MKTVSLNRLVSNKEEKLHKELTDVQSMIEVSLGDFGLNPLITIDEVRDKLTELNQKYHGIIYHDAAEQFDRIFDVLENGVEGVEDVRLDIYGTLLEVFFCIEHIKVLSSAPDVRFTREALENIRLILEHPEAKKLNTQIIR